MGDVSVATGGSTRPLPSGVVTFLLSDVEGSTRLWEAGEDVAAAAIARHYELLDAAISLHNGVRPLEQGEGDSVVGAFAKATDAVAAALDAQRAFVEEPWATAGGVRIRVALHTGEVSLRDERNYFGPTVIRCARLRAIAHGGQVLLSSATHDVVADRAPDDVAFRDLGSHRLKDLGRPERVWQLCHPELVSDFPALRSLDAIANNLPAQLTSFVGRDAELVELREALRHSRLVTLTGAGGCGKTRLALHAAADVADDCPGGAWWVELAAVSAPEMVATAVARVFGLRPEEDRPLVETLCDQLAGLDALLILDNCEQVLGASVDLVERLLRAAPALRVLVTSREPLAVAGELTWRVPSLDNETATRLFVERAAQVRPGFSPDAAETEVVGQICERLDGIALAIELAAARTRMMAPARIAAALDDRFRLLTGASRTAMPRQQTLETSVAWSHDLLDAEERALLRRLSVFAGGFTLDAAEGVCNDDVVGQYAILDLLSRLVDKSLVQVDWVAPEVDRYRLLETIRLYARDRLLESGEADATRSRQCEFFVNLAERAEPELAMADGPAWLARLEGEHENLRAALEWADTTGADEQLLRLVTALTLFWELRGHLREGGRWFQRALARDGEASVVRARALWGAAHVAVYDDDFGTAAERAPQALAMAEAVGDEWAMARALNTLGYLQLVFEPEPARAALARSIELGEKIADNWAVADGLKMITVAWALQDDYDGLREPLEQLRRAGERLNNKFFIAWYHCCAGWAEVGRGEFEDARRSLEASVACCDEVGEPATRGIAVALLGEIDALTGHYEAAETRLTTFLGQASATGAALGGPFALYVLAVLATGTGDPAAAKAVLEPLIAQMRTIGLPTYLSNSLSLFGAALMAEGDDAAASAALVEAKSVVSSFGNPRLSALAGYWLGELARRHGDAQRAEELHHEALALRVQGGLMPGVTDSLEALAALAAAHESFTEATRLFAAASTLRHSMGYVRWPADQASYDKELVRARDALGDDDFDEAWSDGVALNVDAAVAYATRARGERKRPSAGWASLTPTELDVVKLLAEGLTNPQIGERLFIARGTVKTHVAHIFAKLGVAGRTELAAEAIRRQLASKIDP